MNVLRAAICMFVAVLVAALLWWQLGSTTDPVPADLVHSSASEQARDPGRAGAAPHDAPDIGEHPPSASDHERVLAAAGRLVIRAQGEGGAPVSDVLVRVAVVGRGAIGVLCDGRTGVDGEVHLAVPVGSYYVAGEHDTCLVEPVAAVEVRDGQTARVALDCRAGSFVNGRVVMRDLEPVPGALVVANAISGGPGGPRASARRIEVRAGLDGAFVLGPLDRSEYDLSVTAPGRIRSQPQLIHVFSAAEQDLLIEMTYLLAVELEVVDRDSGQPLLAPVPILDGPPTLTSGSVRLSNEMRSYVSPGLVSVDLWTRLRRAGVLTWQVSNRVRVAESDEFVALVHVGGAEHRVTIVRADRLGARPPTRIALAPDHGARAIRVRVAHSDGVDLSERHSVTLVDVESNDKLVFRDLVGSIERVMHVAPGTYRVLARTDGMVGKAGPVVVVEAGTEELTIAVPVGGNLEFNVVDPLGQRTGRCRLVQLQGISGDAQAVGFRDADLWCDLPCVLRSYPPGRYRLSLKRLSSSATWEGEVDVVAHGHAVVDIRL